MECDQARVAISARLDGEESPMGASAVERHLRVCAGCRAWAAAAEGLHGRLRVAPAPAVPDLSRAILDAARPPAPAPEAAGTAARWGLVAVAVIHLAVAVPALVSGSVAGASVHVGRELASWDAALAVGFLVAALRPARAAGMLPLVAAAVACFAAAGFVDVAEGNAAASGETVHALDAAGLCLLWSVARRHRPAVSRPVRTA